MATHPLRVVSLFSGVGGLDAGLSLALGELGIPHQHTLFVERDIAAARVLAQRAEEGSIGPLAPEWGIWSDIRTIPESVGGADLLCGGFPCQDISSAGRGAGVAGGERSGLWFDMLAAAVRLGCRYIFAENVGAITTRGLDLVLGSLAEVGFDAEWCHLSLAQLGFPQKRERWFLLAHAAGQRHERPGSSRTGRDGSAGGECEVAHPNLPRSQGRGVSGPGRADERAAGQERGEVGLPPYPPGPADAEAWGWVLERHPELAPALANPGDIPGQVPQAGASGQPRGGAPAGAGDQRDGGGSEVVTETAQPPIRGVAPGPSGRLDLARADRLRALGNLATPAQSAAAFYHLWQRVHGE